MVTKEFSTMITMVESVRKGLDLSLDALDDSAGGSCIDW